MIGLSSSSISEGKYMRIRDWDRPLKVRLFGEFFSNLSFWMVFPFLAIYFAEEFGASAAGMLLVFSQLFSVAANLVGGYCADRFGRRTMLFFLILRTFPISMHRLSLRMPRL